MREVAKLRVIYGDTDRMGVVYYANYLRYFEVARNEYLRSAGASYRTFEATAGLFLPIVEAFVKYRKPARYDDLLAIWADIPWVKGATARFDYELRRDDPQNEVLATGHTVHACMTQGGRAVRIPDDLRAALTAR